MTWAVETESAMVAEANAATEVTMPLETLHVLADQLFTVLMTFVEGESFDTLVGSGSGEGLEAWRRLHKRWDPLTTARGLLRETFSPGGAKLGGLQGVVERLKDLMRRYTQRRVARKGQRHTVAEEIRMVALEALLPEELERHCQLQRSQLDTHQKLREEVVFFSLFLFFYLFSGAQMLRQFGKGVPGEGHRLERETSSNILFPFQPAACTRHIFINF